MTTDRQYALCSVDLEASGSPLSHSDGVVTAGRGEILEAQMGISGSAADYTVGAFQRSVID